MKLPLLLLLLLAPLLGRAAPTPEQVEFFEKRIRPVLAQECYECHSSTGKRKGGLALDSRAGWEEGGDSGATIVPGDIEKSLLLRTVRHEEPDLKMPRNGAKLDEPVLRDFEAWVKMGAPDPRDHPPTPAELTRDREWPAVLQRRKSWWSFQPIAQPPAPVGDGQPIDRFLTPALAEAGLSPAPEAEPQVILRRLSFLLAGLPPTAAELAAFEAEAAAHGAEAATAAAADRLLASPRFGETWARHWMDWMRYAETHGSEGDPKIPFAWRYRDYLIRALNADVPYPQLVREHLAGDLLPQPRVNAAEGINESALGTAHFRLVLHGFTPTDARDERATFTDNQIDTVTKAFLGLTVACARCHDHKFDAISQTDYYALFGIFSSCRPATVDVNLPERQQAGLAALPPLKARLRGELASAWLTASGDAIHRLEAWTPPSEEKARAELIMNGAGPLTAWLELKDQPPEKWAAKWDQLCREAKERSRRLETFRAQEATAHWDLRGPDFAQWQAQGNGVSQGPQPPGDFHLAEDGPRVVTNVYPAGVFSHLLSDSQRGVLASPGFPSKGGKLWARVRGGGEARYRYVVENYPRTGLIYPKQDLTAEAEQWVGWDLDYWKGDQLYVELATHADQPVEGQENTRRSWFGVSEILYAADAQSAAPPLPGGALPALCGSSPAPRTRAELASLYERVLRGCLEHWQDRVCSDEEAEFLGQFVRLDLLPNTVADLPGVASLVTEYRAGEAKLSSPTRAPGVLEGFAFDQPLFIRGDHKKLGEPVPRRFLEALDPRSYQPGADHSGRLELAASLTDPQNPLVSRVIVNRLWQQVFGRGLVGTPDNFGRLGETPTHPELLDFLASGFLREGGSIKKMLRELVVTRAFRQEARASTAAAERDPENRLLSHFTPRRLEAEAIRDSMVALTGKLVEKQGGEPIGLDGYRRSVYGPVLRNALDPLLSAFDFPTPTACRGRRDATNVPAQALALLNDPKVEKWAEDWAKKAARENGPADETAQVRLMFTEAFGRPPRPEEVQASLTFRATAPGNAGWQSLAQALFNAKEFIYLQ